MGTMLRSFKLLNGEKGVVIGTTKYNQINGVFSIGILENGTFVHFDLADQQNNLVQETMFVNDGFTTYSMYKGLNIASEQILNVGLSKYVGVYLESYNYAFSIT